MNTANAPTAALVGLFVTIWHERMQAVPLLNPALSVEAAGFRPWQGHWLGVLITPWFMNLVLLPDDRQRWVALAPGERRRVRFPAGEFVFQAADEAPVGAYQFCTLFAPMGGFADQSAARLTAHAALDGLMQSGLFHSVAASPAPDPPGLRQRLAADIDRRGFLGGAFFRGGRGRG